jgi:hypothetical protein
MEQSLCLLVQNAEDSAIKRLKFISETGWNVV